MRKNLKLVVGGIVVAGLVVGVFLWRQADRPQTAKQPATKNQAAAKPETTPQTSPQATPEAPQKPASFNKTKHSLTDPASPWVIVNKRNPLTPKTYEPGDTRRPNVPLGPPKPEAYVVRNEAATALERLVTDAKTAGINLILVSAYRTYSYQVRVYDSLVNSRGAAAADRISARPGHSEHQTGLAVDLGSAGRSCELESCFGNMPEGKWLAAHAHTYGFIVRYPAGKEPITGYDAEPWHLRYVGAELSNEMRRQNIFTLEEFFGLPAAPSYAN